MRASVSFMEDSLYHSMLHVVSNARNSCSAIPHVYLSVAIPDAFSRTQILALTQDQVSWPGGLRVTYVGMCAEVLCNDHDPTPCASMSILFMGHRSQLSLHVVCLPLQRASGTHPLRLPRRSVCGMQGLPTRHRSSTTHTAALRGLSAV